MNFLLQFIDVSFSYNHKEDVLKHISFSMSEGEKVALLGLNGSGKSTLMLHTNGLLLPKSGDVFVKGMNTRSKSIRNIRKNVGMVFQNADDQLFMSTVWDDIAFGPINMGCSKEDVKMRVEYALKSTKTTTLAHKSPFELSGGQKKSVSIATVLSMMPEILVMDEPTAGLDHNGITNFIELMKKTPQAQLISTHDMEVAKNLCNRAIIMEKGEIIFDGDITGL